MTHVLGPLLQAGSLGSPNTRDMGRVNFLSVHGWFWSSALLSPYLYRESLGRQGVCVWCCEVWDGSRVSPHAVSGACFCSIFATSHLSSPELGVQPTHLEPASSRDLGGSCPTKMIP